jgi:hypothetical protein
LLLPKNLRVCLQLSDNKQDYPVFYGNYQLNNEDIYQMAQYLQTYGIYSFISGRNSLYLG